MDLFLQILTSSLSVGAMYALIALGFALVLGTLKVVDFSYGTYVVVAAYATYVFSTTVMTGGGVVDAVFSVLFGVLVTAVFGAFVWGVLLRKLLDRTHMTQLVGTIGVSTAVGGCLLAYFGTNVVSANFEPMRQTLQFGPVYIGTGRLAGGIIGLIALVFFMYVLRTRIGLMIRGIALDPKGAALVGIDIGLLRIVTVAVGAAMAGLAGGLLVTFLPIGPTSGNRFLLIAFFTVAVGGLGSLRGALMGAFLIAMVETFSQSYAPNMIKNAIPYIFVGCFIALLPQGLGNVRLALTGRRG